MDNLHLLVIPHNVTEVEALALVAAFNLDIKQGEQMHTFRYNFVVTFSQRVGVMTESGFKEHMLVNLDDTARVYGAKMDLRDGGFVLTVEAHTKEEANQITKAVADALVVTGDFIVSYSPA